MIKSDSDNARIINPIVDGSLRNLTFINRKKAAITTIIVIKLRIEMVSIRFDYKK